MSPSHCKCRSLCFELPCRFREKHLCLCKKSIPLLDAANFFIAYATGLYGLRECGRLQPGETVLVLGASGTTGSTAIEIAKAMGAKVIACASSDDKLEFAKAHGAEFGLNYANEDLKDGLRRLTGGKGLHVCAPVNRAIACSTAEGSIKPPEGADWLTWKNGITWMPWRSNRATDRGIC